MDTIQTIESSIEAGEVLVVAYHGGSKPGTVREIAPISMRNGKVRARCYSSNAVKTFIAEKIEILNSLQDKPSEKWEASIVPYSDCESISSFIENDRSDLEKLGWFVQCSQDDHAQLFRYFKNGKLRKTSDIDISCNEYTYDLVYGADGVERKENYRKSKRPWVVRAKGSTTSSFSILHKAITKFIDHANILAPKNEI